MVKSFTMSRTSSLDTSTYSLNTLSKSRIEFTIENNLFLFNKYYEYY